MYNGKIYDAQSFEVMKKSFVDNFTKSRTLGSHNLLIQDAAVNSYGAYLEQQLTYIIPQVLKQEYPDTPALNIFNVSNEGSLEKIIVTRMKSFTGQHTREHENKGTPKGVIAVGYDASGIKVEEFGAISLYKELDLLRAAMLGDALDASIIEAHDISYKTVADKIAFLGMSNEYGTSLVTGILNSTPLAACTGTATSLYSAASTTGLTMYSDIKKIVSAQIGECGGAMSLHVDTLVTSPRVYATLASTTYGTSSSDYQNPITVLEMVKKNLGITAAYATKWCSELDGTGKDRIVLFNRQPKCMTLHVPQPLKFSEVFKRNFSYEIESMFRIAGLKINQKVAYAYLKEC